MDPTVFCAGCMRGLPALVTRGLVPEPEVAAGTPKFTGAGAGTGRSAGPLSLCPRDPRAMEHTASSLTHTLASGKPADLHGALPEVCFFLSLGTPNRFLLDSGESSSSRASVKKLACDSSSGETEAGGLLQVGRQDNMDYYETLKK